jgi:DNA-binding CsgD family transcriptional regulator
MPEAAGAARAEGLAVGSATDDGERRRRIALSALLLAIALGGATDLSLDWPERPSGFHVAFELSLMALSLGGVAALWLGWSRTRRSLAHTREASAAHRAERDAWRARAEKLLRGLGEEIDAQLRAWGLTPVERETALLLLKGYGHKEIAALLGKSERTVRQQAVAVYRKSELGGRAELAAFFLEDLLLPAGPERGA